MSPSPKSPPHVQTRRSGLAISLLRFLVILVFPAVLAGCGGGQEEDAVLATVGNSEIKASYYESRLRTLKEEELPRDAAGFILDMSLLEGKKRFVETLINKEVMVLTAESMGMQKDPKVMEAKKYMTTFEANKMLWERVIGEPSRTISPEELEAFYAKMGSSRSCLYVICNFLDGAEAARKMALDGADWEDIVNEHHDGFKPASGNYETIIPFGRYKPEFESVVFSTEIGDVTPPIDTTYGYWVLKILNEKPGKKPPLEEAKAQILDVIMTRKSSNMRENFKNSVLEKFQVTIHEDALWKCFLALPEGETIFYEGTKDVRKGDDLKPLDIATEDMDMPFYSYLGRDGVREFTLLDYKIRFDNMSAFQRPKDAEGLGSLRAKIKGEIGEIVLKFEAEDRGMREDPEVVAKVDFRIEQMLVNNLYKEVIKIEEKITTEEEEAFWAEHSQEYVLPESRTGRLVICRDAEQAAEARTKASEGMVWKDILLAYGTDADNKSRSGKLDGVIELPVEPVSAALFAMQPGELSEPIAMDDGRYGIVKLESVTPTQAQELSDVIEAVYRRMLEVRKEEAFQAMLDKWKEDIPVTIHEENLADLASWKELKTVELPGVPVKRN